jgi:gas vesicle protein
MNKNSVNAWLCGLATGLVAGFLFAPKSGRALRQELADTAIDTGRQLRTKALDTVEIARSRAQDAVAAGREAYQTATAART